MANATLDNGALGELEVSSKTLSGGIELEGVELVTATEGGTRVDLAKAEDSAHVSGHFGLMALAVRKDTAISLADNDGDYVPLIVDAAGALHARINNPLPPGGNNIGSVDVGSAPAADRASDSVAAALVTDAMMIDNLAVTPKFKSQSVASGATDASVVAAVASKKIRVLALASQCGATPSDLTLESDEASDVRKHKITPGANGGQILPFNPVGWFETAAGSALIATSTAGSATEISIVYIEV